MLVPGTKVKISKSKSVLHEEIGEIISYRALYGDYAVQLDKNNKIIHLKEKNLEVFLFPLFYYVASFF